MDLIIEQEHIDAAARSWGASDHNRDHWDLCGECTVAQAMKDAGYTGVRVHALGINTVEQRFVYAEHQSTKGWMGNWRLMTPTTLVLEEE